jgi:hypothetical protein
MQTYQCHYLALAASVTAAVLGISPAALANTPQQPHAASHTACQVEGVWEQVSVAFDGHEMGPYSRPPRKIVAHGHWIWIGADARRDTLPRQTEADKLRATQIFGGAGTYTTTDSTFTQHIDYFFDPSAEGATLVASCRTEGNFWYYTFSTIGVPGMGSWPKRVSEVWRRLR